MPVQGKTRGGGLGVVPDRKPQPACERCNSLNEAREGGMKKWGSLEGLDVQSLFNESLSIEVRKREHPG